MCRDEHRAPLLDRLDGRLGEGRGVGEPLLGEPRLDDHVRAVSVGQFHEVFLGPLEQAEGIHALDDALARLHAVEAAVFLGGVFVEAGVGIEHVDHLQAMPAPHREVVEVVGRRDLDRTRPLFRIGVLVGDDRHAAPDDGQDAGLSDEVPVSPVVRMDRHRGIAQHGFGTGRADGDEALRLSFDGVPEVPHGAGDVALVDLQVRDRRVQLGIPVDQALVLVDQSLLEKLDEDLAHGGGEAVVHGEALARPVARRPETAQLPGDGAAGLGLPLPNGLDEFLAAQVVPRHVLIGEALFHHHLRGDSRVVGARLPQDVAAAHALEAHQDVLHGVVQRVPHVQAAGDVGRRDDDGVRFGIGAAAAGEGPGFFPTGMDFFLDLGGPIGLVQHR